MSDTSRECGSLTLPAELANLGALQEHLVGCAAASGLAQKRVGMLAMAFEEVFVNICHYAYPAGPGSVTLRCREAGGQFVVEVVDEGIAFDAALIGEPDLQAGVDDRKIGGLGWFLVRRVADRLDCFRQDGRNVVRLALNR